MSRPAPAPAPAPRSASSSARRALGAIVAAALFAAMGCGGSPQNTASCPALDSPQFTSALDNFLTGLDPMPLRYLVYSAGDSALPEAAKSNLEAKNPTYIFPVDSAGQQKQLAALRSQGAYPTLLVLYLGMQTEGPRATIRLTGRYLDKEDVGKPVPVKSSTFECRDRRWQTPASATQHST